MQDYARSLVLAWRAPILVHIGSTNKGWLRTKAKIIALHKEENQNFTRMLTQIIVKGRRFPFNLQSLCGSLILPEWPEKERYASPPEIHRSWQTARFSGELEMETDCVNLPGIARPLQSLLPGSHIFLSNGLQLVAFLPHILTANSFRNAKHILIIVCRLTLG